MNRPTGAVATVPPAQRVLDALMGITRQIGAGRDLATIFGTVADELVELLPYERCSIGLLEPDGEHLRIIGLRGRFSVDFREGLVSLAGTIGGWCVAERRPVLYELGPDDRFLEDAHRRAVGIRQVALVPILVDDRPIGVLTVSSIRPDAYHAGQLWILQTIGDHLGLAVAATNLRGDAERRAARSQFLAETGQLFASSLDLEQTLRRAVGRAAEVLGDLNAVFLRHEESGEVQLRGLSHPDQAVEAAAWAHSRAHGLDPEGFLTGQALHGEPVLFAHLSAEDAGPGLRETVSRLRLHSALAVPLRASGRVIGVLGSACTAAATNPDGSPRILDGDDLAFAQDIAAQMASAVENARLHAATQRALDESEALRRIGQELTSSIELDRTLELVASFARLLLGADYAAVAGEGADGDFAWRAITGNRTETHLGVRYEPGQGAVGRAMAARQVVSIDPATAGQTLGDEAAIHVAEGDRAVLAVPLVVGERAVGALVLGYRTAHDFTPADGRLAAALAAQAALVLENARLFDAARRAVAARDEFLIIAAHELRTPLTTLRGRAQLLQRRLAEVLPAQDLESLGVMRRQLERLTRMVNDLLDVSRLRSGGLLPVPERVDLVALCRVSVEEFETARHPIGFEPAVAELVGWWDPWRLDQVLANLLSNAVRYSPPQSPITMRLAREGAEARLDIVDRGTGIPAAELDRIFEPYYRGEQQNRAGFGLGLAICHRIIAAHGGSLRASSDGPGTGATFTIRLPLGGGETERDG